ncbi:hypothetical protein PFICI_12817 [Pestalotiopsis fici W106-1]|uniref:Uncharacterized protein n=1 Tax=Pestalotiopsis fici (strain W106-1 / CGMCC3.15140) TaxID=1229662 RepID=W3WPT6_PESFW|nr:uncharacterized protein PFICI_12817 [Pestalotiopsis fici W106-1]ETS75873.1 hypothetical protein PFICI_12817 [Pestalotiopsis fici W106-1]
MAAIIQTPTIMSIEREPSTFLEGFFQHVQSLAQDSSYQYLRGVLEENSNLKGRNHILNITNEENYRAISKLQVHLDDCSKRYEDQSQELATLTQERTSWSEKAAQLESDAEWSKKELDIKAEALSRLEIEAATKTADLEAKDAELESTKTELAQANTRLNTTESDLQVAEEQLDETKANLESMINDLERSKTELSESRTALETLDAELKLANIRLEEAVTTLESTKTQLQGSIDQCSSIQVDLNVKSSDLESLHVSLDEEKSALTAAQSALEKTTADLQLTRDDLERKNTRLGELNALSFNLKCPPQDQTQQHLQNMFTLSYHWAESLFANDLEETDFMAPTASTNWAKMRNHGRVHRMIPLPLSNTREAKKMRTAAVLAILAWALAQYVFQPTYLLQCNELCDLLGGLADDDPVRENYLRSVLLPVLPSRQKANGKRRIEQVVLEVFTAVSPVLPASRHDEIRTSLETICKQICGQWMRLQLLDEKIEPSFDAYDEEDWRLLLLDGSEGETLKTPTGTNVIAAAAAAADESAIADDDRPDGVTDIEEIAAVLWPSFLSLGGGESELLSEGFVLAKAQVKPAYSEERAAQQNGAHRAARQMSRRDRTKSFTTTANGEDDDASGSDKTSFLPTDPVEDGGGGGGAQLVHDRDIPSPSSSDKRPATQAGS